MLCLHFFFFLNCILCQFKSSTSWLALCVCVSLERQDRVLFTHSTKSTLNVWLCDRRYARLTEEGKHVLQHTFQEGKTNRGVQRKLLSLTSENSQGMTDHLDGVPLDVGLRYRDWFDGESAKIWFPRRFYTCVHGMYGGLDVWCWGVDMISWMGGGDIWFADENLCIYICMGVWSNYW